jgi:hypothetical protein
LTNSGKVRGLLNRVGNGVHLQKSNADRTSGDELIKQGEDGDISWNNRASALKAGPAISGTSSIHEICFLKSADLLGFHSSFGHAFDNGRCNGDTPFLHLP